MEFFSIENLTSPLVNTGLDPRSFTRPPFGSKEKFKAWCAHRDTHHCFYSLYEGLAPQVYDALDLTIRPWRAESKFCSRARNWLMSCIMRCIWR